MEQRHQKKEGINSEVIEGTREKIFCILPPTADGRWVGMTFSNAYMRQSRSEVTSTTWSKASQPFSSRWCLVAGLVGGRIPHNDDNEAFVIQFSLLLFERSSDLV
jgi:hypothetical protein